MSNVMWLITTRSGLQVINSISCFEIFFTRISKFRTTFFHCRILTIFTFEILLYILLTVWGLIDFLSTIVFISIFKSLLELFHLFLQMFHLVSLRIRSTKQFHQLILEVLFLFLNLYNILIYVVILMIVVLQVCISVLKKWDKLNKQSRKQRDSHKRTHTGFVWEYSKGTIDFK